MGGAVDPKNGTTNSCPASPVLCLQSLQGKYVLGELHRASLKLGQRYDSDSMINKLTGPRPSQPVSIARHLEVAPNSLRKESLAVVAALGAIPRFKMD